MIKVLEKELLDDKFIDKNFVDNIYLNNKLIFNKNNIYYFGNYKKENLNIIKEKLLKNKKNIINAVEKNIKFIICGNSEELFNNTFKCNDINLFTYYYKRNNKIIKIDNLKKGICASNFKYKNLIYIRNEKNINKIIKKIK